MHQEGREEAADLSILPKCFKKIIYHAVKLDEKNAMHINRSQASHSKQRNATTCMDEVAVCNLQGDRLSRL